MRQINNRLFLVLESVKFPASKKCIQPHIFSVKGGSMPEGSIYNISVYSQIEILPVGDILVDQTTPQE